MTESSTVVAKAQLVLSALTSVMKELDGPVMEYIAGCLADEPYQDADELYQSIGDLLVRALFRWHILPFTVNMVSEQTLDA